MDEKLIKQTFDAKMKRRRIELEAKCGLEFSRAGGGVLSSIRPERENATRPSQRPLPLRGCGGGPGLPGRIPRCAGAGLARATGVLGPGLLVSSSPVWSSAQNPGSEMLPPASKSRLRILNGEAAPHLGLLSELGN